MLSWEAMRCGSSVYMSLNVPAISDGEQPLGKDVLYHAEEHGIGEPVGTFAASRASAPRPAVGRAGIVQPRRVDCPRCPICLRKDEPD